MRHACPSIAFLFLLAGCATGSIGSGASGQPLFSPPRSPSDASSKIQHVVIIFQENRSTDNLFNGFPGADTVRSGFNTKGQEVPIKPVSLGAPYDLNHEHFAFVLEYSGGKMNGFNNEPSTCLSPLICAPQDVRAYGYVPHDEIVPYWTMASRYTLADHMFQTNQGPSFPAHQYILSGTSAIADGSPLKASENVFVPSGAPGGGCDSPSGSLVDLIDPAGVESRDMFPCFNRISLMQLIDQKSLTWRYYQALPGAGVWNGPDAILPIRESSEFAQDVAVPSTQILTDIENGHLASVVWVTPTALASDHALATNGSGPSWVASIVNAIGESDYWNSTAIFVTWDDWGGWYDHVTPHIYNSYELGFRVPLLVISPYAKTHYVSHVQYEFGSILKTTEEFFGLPSMHTTDARANDLSDCFNFSQSPTPFKPIPAKYPPSYFFKLPQTEPDN